MKTKYLMAVLTMGMSVAAMAQENDDMYFNAKDRDVLNKANQIVLAKRYQQDDMNAVRTNPVNPSDSYSGRGVNPEYNAQSKNGTSVVQNNPDYFLSGYQAKNVNGSLYSGGASAYSNRYGNSAYNNYYGNMGMGYGSRMGMGMGYGSMFSMGYGSMMGMGYGGYSSFYSPYSSFYSPYSMFSMGYGSMYGSPYSSMMYGGMYSPYSYGGYGSPYGGVTVINGGDGRATVTGRHSSRSNGLNNYVDNNRSTNNATIVGTNGRVREGGRVSGNSTPNYYDRAWRDNSSNFSNNNGNGQGNNTRSGWGGNNNGWGNNSGGATRSSYDSFNSGSRGSFGGGGVSGGSSGGGGGGGGGGHSRGRN